MKRTSFLVCLLMLAAASQPARGVTTPAAPPPQRPAPYAEARALLIGMEKYDESEWRLEGVAYDLGGVETALREVGFQVEKAINLKAEELRSRIEKFIADYGQREENGLLIYYAGHGYLLKSEGGEEVGYVVPVDAPKPARDPAGFRRKALAMPRIREYVGRIKAKHALFVFDSCFAGTMVRSGGPPAGNSFPPFPGLLTGAAMLNPPVPGTPDYTSPAEQYKRLPVRLFITSGTLRQTASNDSAFKEKFVDGLKSGAPNNADFDLDGVVLGTELGQYLAREVTGRLAGAQTPSYAKSEDPRMSQGDFLFVLPRPPEPIPLNADRNLWQWPKAWPARGNLVTALSPGAALPRDRARYSFRDSQMCARFRLLDETAAEFLMRARDEKNYYLIQLTGEKFQDKARRNNVQAFAVRGGEPIPMAGSPVNADRNNLVEEMKAKKYLQIQIKVRGKEVNVWIHSDEGQRLIGPVTFVDEGFSPKAGMPGFVRRDGGRFEFDLNAVVVTPVTPDSTLCAPTRRF